MDMLASIGSLRCPPLRGRIGIMSAPGIGKSTVDQTMDALSEMGVKLFVSLLTPDEVSSYGLCDLRKVAHARGIGTVRYPIEPLGLPPSSAELSALIGGVIGVVSTGGVCVISGGAGLGRSGMVAACCLVQLGRAPEDAIAMVRKTRPEAIETESQLEFVRRFYQYPTMRP